MYSIYSFFSTAVVQHIEIVKKTQKNRNFWLFAEQNAILHFPVRGSFPEDCRTAKRIKISVYLKLT